MNEKYDRDSCLTLLRNKQEQLRAEGQERYVRRSDFKAEEEAAIKSFFGPWPRALEAAGLKEPRDASRIEKNRQKRMRAKQNRLASKKQKNDLA
ncbi:MAG TPA: hypothetical protein PLT66_03730 [Bacillota bacterium]|nr:hypothetical protein [Bacillota bacterium]